MGLFKSFAVHEEMHFEFRAEAFNIFNHTQWNAINNNAATGCGLRIIAFPHRDCGAQCPDSAVCRQVCVLNWRGARVLVKKTGAPYLARFSRDVGYQVRRLLLSAPDSSRVRGKKHSNPHLAKKKASQMTLPLG